MIPTNTSLVCKSVYIFKKLPLWKNGNYEFLKFSKAFCSEIKYTAKLFSEVEEALDSNKIKHRNHPGIRKLKTIALPDILIKGVDRVISSYTETTLLREANELKKLLYFRRLPIEIDEIKSRLYNVFPQECDSSLSDNELLLASKSLRPELTRWKPLEYTQHNSKLYLVARLAANYAAIAKVFTEIMREIPCFKPTTFFDFGSGVGSGLWAANSIWGDSMKEYFCVDASSHMNDLAQELLKDENSDEMIIKTIFFRQFFPASDKIKYDVVLSAFSLLDLSSLKERITVIDTLWRKTNDILVIIEYGNLAGFSAVLDARDYILKIENELNHDLTSGVHIVTPCPHDFACQLSLQKSTHPCGVHVPYYSLFPRRHRCVEKNDWISYVVLRKGHRSEERTLWPRIVKPVLKRTRHVICRLCCEDGDIREIIFTKSKHGRNAYRCARSSRIGDLLPIKLIHHQDEKLNINDLVCKNSHELDCEGDNLRQYPKQS